jgi:hypothetical protein
MAILDRDREIELVTASLRDGVSSKSPDYEADFVAVRRGRPLLVEVKLTTPQTSYRLEQQIYQIQAAGRSYMERHADGLPPGLVLAVPGVLPESKKAKAARANLETWDGPYLRARAEQFGIEIPSGVAFSGVGVSLEAEPELMSRLASIKPGNAGWRAYENYCDDLLNFLFVPPLNPPIPQSHDERNVNRRDYVLPNYALDGGFWQFMRTHYEAHLVVAEVKNLRREPGKREILQVANYLNPRGTGLFALVLARRDLDETARWICREQWVQHSKLIVGLSDDDVIQMVRTKMAGNDPAELIRQKIEDFRLKI